VTGLGRLASRSATSTIDRIATPFHDRHLLPRNLTKSHDRSLLSMINSGPQSNYRVRLIWGKSLRYIFRAPQVRRPRQ
jgi:hypothetical protein